MTSTQRIKNDSVTTEKRNIQDKIIEDNRIRNDELTTQRRIKANQLLLQNRTRNDAMTLGRRKTNDSDEWKNFTLALLIFILVAATSYSLLYLN